MQLQNILLVEDHLADARLVQRMLRGISAEIIHTRQLESACQIIRARAHLAPADGGIDVVLMDLGRSDAVGLEGVRRLRHLASHIPCIVMTGALEPDVGPAVLQEGAEDFISKTGLNPSRLARAIDYAIERNKRLQASLEAEAGLRRIVEAHPDAMLVIGTDNRIKLANPAAASLLGHSARQLVGNPPPFPLPEETPTLLDLPGLLGDRTVEIVTARTSWKGTPAWLASLRDVSHRKREDRLRRQLEHTERLAVLGQFAAGVAHEVNNPATVLMTNLQLLRMELPSLRAALQHDKELVGALQESEDMLAESVRGITRITHLTRSLQGFVEASRCVTELVDLAELLRGTCARSSHSTPSVARLEFDIGELPSIIASREALSQAFFNLVRNALQAIPAQSPDTHVITIRARQVDSLITISVTDTGVGVPVVLRDRIFEPFYTTRKPGEGSGLGLPLARDIVRRHGGELRLASTPGEPTRFVVILPIDTQLPSRPAPAKSRPAPQSGRVLLIDDEPMVRRTLSQQLSRSGLDVAIADNGLEAMAILSHDTEFDVILCDMMMPELDGSEFYAALKDIHPALTHRVLFYSGATLPRHLHTFQSTVKRPVLRKPLSRLKLLNAVQELIRQRDEAEE